MGSFDSIQESFDDSEVDLDKPSAKSLSKFVDEWVKDSYETLDGDFKHQKDKQTQIKKVYKTLDGIHDSINKEEGKYRS